MADLTCSIPDCPYAKPKRLWGGLCGAHYQRKRKGLPLEGGVFRGRRDPCNLCGDPIPAGSRARLYCSAECRTASAWGYEAPLTCHDCGKRMMANRTSRPQGEARCIECIGRVSGRAHGISRYKIGCRCDVCIQAKSDSMRAFMEAFRAEQGVSYATAWRKKFRAEHGYWPQRHGGQWITYAERMAIYERDDWMCHLCGDRVDADAEFNDDMAPSLDHLIPRSLGGSDDPSNLKTAHRGCNARRGAKPLEEVAA